SEAVLCGGHGINGIKVNAKAETDVRGLYATGDGAANATSLMGAFALGRIAGREAASLGKDLPVLEISAGEAEAERKRVLEPLNRPEGIPPALLERKTRQTVNLYVDNPKSEPKLLAARAHLEKLRKDASALKAADLHDAMKAVEVGAILDCADMVTAASLARRESRWGIYHYRVDFPERDDANWKKFVVVKRDRSGRAATAIEPIPGD
ncbi:MAG TPA: fumarate reductase/succinate dehydrogenase flavoprotein subunit, partial [Thermodesulfobacteriota bacterium]|nr:fumarate reductase/succinate dehydrogenase flavoprotein subunit [Thermodesulfobacteriota bacterium]